MKNVGIKATSIGIVVNLILFLIKIYAGISTQSLAIYCDAINNLGDIFACALGVFGFILVKKNVGELKSLKIQSLCTFVIGLIIGVTGLYFAYIGLERIMYPLPINYAKKYLYLMVLSLDLKAALGYLYYFFNKKSSSPVLKALVVDSVLDCGMTTFALMGLVIISKLNFSIDGFFAVIMGIIVAISAFRNIKKEAKFLVNN